MERCFIIEENAKLHKKYMDYTDLNSKNTEAVKKFILDNIKETMAHTSYIIYSDTLGITMSDGEHEKFKNQLKNDPLYCGSKNGPVYIFKKNSPIAKEYKKLGITAVRCPSIGFEISTCYHELKGRLFDYKGVVYGSLESEELKKDDSMPVGWREISKSEFYAVIDEIERSVK